MDVEDEEPVASLPRVTQGAGVVLVLLDVGGVEYEFTIVYALQLEQDFVEIRIREDKCDHIFLFILNFQGDLSADVFETFWILLA